MQFSTETNQNQNILTLLFFFFENPVSIKKTEHNWNDEHFGRKGWCETLVKVRPGGAGIASHDEETLP